MYNGHRNAYTFFMRYTITKERTHLFSPSINIGVLVHILGDVETDALRQAIGTAVRHNGILLTKIVVTDSGDAYYAPIDDVNCSVTVENAPWQDIIDREEKIRFKLEDGEFIRFFIMPQEHSTGLLLYGHHLLGDGTSLAFLVQDIMRALDGETLTYKPLQLFSMEDLPRESRLPGLSRMLANHENRIWQKTGKAFSFTDFDRLFTSYWTTHKTVVRTARINGERYTALIHYSQEQGITINSIILTALIMSAGEPSDVGMAASIRKPGYEGMGNFATGISIQYAYRNSKTFAENAKAVQRLVQKKLENPKKKYFLLQFMGSLTPTLIDAAFFSAYDGYENRTARQFQKLFGYDGNPKGISVTNLTRLPIRQEYGCFRIDDFIFVPPLVTNAKRIIGVATLGDSMVLSLHVEDDAHTERQAQFFAKAVSFMENLGTSTF